MERENQYYANAAKLFVHEQFEFWVKNTPDQVALKFRDQSLTYQQLNSKSNQLAHYLLDQNIGPESHVVVCVEPGFEIVLSLLAIFKVGATYIPLDPTYPVRRIEAILEDTTPTLLITKSTLQKKLNLENQKTFNFDTEEAILANLSTENPNTEINRTQTASIYYTSGTTGKPKGVMASYGNVQSYIRSANSRYLVNPLDIMPAIARFGFSISMFELMLPLTSGGTLIILDREHILDLPRLAETLTQITFFHMGPSLLKGLLSYLKLNRKTFQEFRHIRHASSGGDMIPPEVLEDLKLVFENAEVFVIYGCSEISCMGCTYFVPRNEKVTKTFVGTAFDRTLCMVLDRERLPVPIGEVGEVYFAGDGIVKGYLNRPELTDQKFTLIDGIRFYATGDLGRKNTNGFLEILGRADFQIKMRGMRIEPAEVEYHIRQVPGVKDGVVAAKANLNGDKILVAFVVFEKNEGQKSMSLIRHHLSETLPDYMVPSRYIELESLPLNHNLKLDRLALPELDDHIDRNPSHLMIREPITPTEVLMASLWKNLLKVHQVGLDDNFFDLGGQSILALEFSLEIKKTLGVELEGMDILRESLSILASIADRKLSIQNEKPKLTPTRLGNQCSIQTFHFSPNQDLFGVLHLPNPDIRIRNAVLICAPIGQESVRAHFILNKLARALASEGTAVMRFDYYGCGDSFGDSENISLERWKRDVYYAYEELKLRTKTERISALGVRLGANLLCQQTHKIDLTRMILWDPIIDLKNFDLSENSHNEFSTLAIDLNTAPPSRLLFSTNFNQGLKFNALPIEVTDYNVVWNEISQTNDLLPDVGISRTLMKMINEDLCTV